MFRISADTVLNRLTITLNGKISREDTELIMHQIFRETETLNPGFSVINNISKFKSLDKVTPEVMSQIAEFLKSKGCRKIIRVVGASKEALLTFAQNSKHIKNYNVLHVATMDAALKELKIL